MSNTLSPNELDELARRCEAAKGPDRLLDGEIWRVAHGLTIYDVLTPEGEISVGVPALTASIDAALTLVPEGIELVTLVIVNREGYSPSAGIDAGKHIAHAATPALALCAAALRTQAQGASK